MVVVMTFFVFQHRTRSSTKHRPLKLPHDLDPLIEAFENTVGVGENVRKQHFFSFSHIVFYSSKN